MHKNTKTQKHKTQKHKNTKTQKTQKHKNSSRVLHFHTSKSHITSNMRALRIQYDQKLVELVGVLNETQRRV